MVAQDRGGKRAETFVVEWSVIVVIAEATGFRKAREDLLPKSAMDAIELRVEGEPRHKAQQGAFRTPNS